jgi:2-desacetyl-2-hydroxyethyl bacteriochlorophyllide A dehydrogenase
VRAVVAAGVGVVEVVDVPDPLIEEPTDAIVRVRLAGICGSDLHFFHGKAPVEPGGQLGHEAVGVVETVGRHVAGVRPGDRVVVAFHNACGACWFCRRGQTQLCENFRNLGSGAFGPGLGGAQAELLRVPNADTNLLRVPDGVDDERAVFVSDVLATAVYAVAIAGLEVGDTVAVVGAGPVGYCCALVAREAGAASVVVIDLDPARLDLLRSAGIDVVDANREDPESALAERTEGRGADVAIDAVGDPAAFASAAEVARRGGSVVVTGMYTSEEIELQLGVWWARAMSLRFTGVCPVHAWWDRAMAMVAEGRLDPTPLISHRLPLEDAAHGYELFAGRRATKVVLAP